MKTTPPLTLRPLDLIVQPEAKTILSHIQKCASFAIIAGGYLRDRYFDVPVKDIDVFVSADLDVAKLKRTFDGYAYEDSKQDDASDMYNTAMAEDNNPLMIHNLKHVKRPPIQVIAATHHDTIESVLQSFDFGFCQIAFDGRNVLVTNNFWQDAANGTATALTSSNSSITHYERLKAKYPNVQWVNIKVKRSMDDI